MNKINTTEKGDLFEKQVYELLKDLLENEEFFLPGKRSKIFLKKSYVSVLTNNKIIVDISIETYLPDAEKYSQLTIIECKNYKTPIPVNDIREFRTILDEIGPHNTKGILISKSGFDKGVHDTAKVTGIGLCKIKGKNELDWVNYRVDKKYNHYNIETINSCLTTESKSSFFAFFDNNCFENIPDLLINMGVLDKYLNKQEFVNIPYRTEEQIVESINELPKDIYTNNGLDIEILCRILADKYKVEFEFTKNLGMYKHNKILGKITFSPMKVFISKELENEIYRWRFTFAHEIGHLILHSEILKQYIDTSIDVENMIFNTDFSSKSSGRMEIQANIFATCLLLPQNPFLFTVWKYFKEINNYKGYLYLDKQMQNKNLVYGLLNEIKQKFGVSYEVGKNRLKSLNLLRDETDNSLNNLLRKL